MSEYVTLLGTEGVRAAGHQMERAADTMRNAAGELETALQREAQRRDEFLDRLEYILKTDAADRVGQTIKLVVDGQVLAEAVLRNTPRVLTKKGITG